MARAVRGKLLSQFAGGLRMAARIAGASESRIVFRHMLPGFYSPRHRSSVPGDSGHYHRGNKPELPRPRVCDITRRQRTAIMLMQAQNVRSSWHWVTPVVQTPAANPGRLSYSLRLTFWVRSLRDAADLVRQALMQSEDATTIMLWAARAQGLILLSSRTYRKAQSSAMILAAIHLLR